MKYMRKIFAMVLAVIMVMSLAIGASAAGNATITISNAAKGESYSIYKLFDATVSADGESIAYTGEIPDSLKPYFEKDTAGNISATEAAGTSEAMSDGLKAALAAWAEEAEATATKEGNGGALVFGNLEYGYYVVSTTQGAAITVTSTKPNATIYDKNSSTPNSLTKSVGDDDEVNIGDTVTYTVTFNTSNYDGSGEEAKQITSYIITDTLPEFLSDVNVTSIIVDNDADTTTTDDQTDVTAQFVNKQIIIEWVDAKGNSKYQNGASIIITYTAVVTDKANIDGEGNKNKVTVQWTVNGSDDPTDDKLEVEETIYTYAIALKKVNEKGEALSGATFQFPFYVQATADEDGAYIYAGTKAGEGLTNTITTPDSGEIVVKGVDAGKYEITETVAPAGYNKLTTPVVVTAVKTGETMTEKTFYIDAEGNVSETGSSTTTVTYKNDALSTAVVVVVNMTGSVLPSTGGMGTTIFYVAGAMLVLAAAVLLVTKRRMNVAE